ncbi:MULTISPECIES: helix-turn-helix domain-containing protein [Rhodococcus]|uniref:HTH iclR-type domain-containing protein n=2 Tax=Rhodococcus TaxID=1827 RepID=A0A3S3B332_9NOCA|nr:hypothetical protein EGT50_11100 [Rhodococcus xishaensis]RVW02419.1 hypothetical protein EF834_12625 [Rhodococcus spongiicola]
MSAVEIGKLTGMSRATVYRLLATVETETTSRPLTGNGCGPIPKLFTAAITPQAPRG